MSKSVYWIRIGNRHIVYLRTQSSGSRWKFSCHSISHWNTNHKILVGVKWLEEGKENGTCNSPKVFVWILISNFQLFLKLKCLLNNVSLSVSTQRYDVFVYLRLMYSELHHGKDLLYLLVPSKGKQQRLAYQIFNIHFMKECESIRRDTWSVALPSLKLQAFLR